MPQVLHEEFRLLIKCSLDVVRSARIVFSKTLRKEEVHSADAKLLLTSFFLGGSGEGLEHGLDRLEWSLNAPGLNIRKGQRQFSIDGGLGAQGDLVAFHLGFQEVAHIQADRFADRGGKGYLVFGFDFY